MADLPAPPVHKDLDLRDFRWMKLDLIALFNSDFNATTDDCAWRAGVTLWGKAWHQVPAGSLPDDDGKLCNFAGLGRDIKTWKRIKEAALHGFVKCSDGRLYHSYICTMAVEAETERKRFEERKARDRARKQVEHFAGIPTERAVNSNGNPSENAVEGQGQGQGADRDRENTSQPTSHQNKSNNFISDLSGKKNGKNHTVSVPDPIQRVARFQKKLAAFIGDRGEEITLEAMNLDDPRHAESLEFCRRKAVDMGAEEFPWSWPLEHMGDVKAARARLKAVADQMRASNRKPNLEAETAA